MHEMTRSEIDLLLAEQPIGRLCMASTDGRPYSIPLPFCWLDGALYLRVALTGRKGDFLRANDNVCFEVDAYTQTLDDYASVLIEGQLVPVDDLDQKSHVKRANDDKYNRLRNGYRPGHGRSTPLADLPLRKIAVRQLTGRKKEPTPCHAATYVTAPSTRQLQQPQPSTF
jgi:nitroimidazol reductase NimA-like FMN-containing flavoprotein (pyridoxamine 5'-phosphate oxidase superfamily)